MQGNSIHTLVHMIVGMLFFATLVGILARKMRFPYTVGLVLMGLVFGLLLRNQASIPPALILELMVPPLVFEAAFHTGLRELRRDLAPILALAIPGVILTMLLVGVVVSWGGGFSLPVALVFGALISTTDPISVVALFRSLGAPKRLQTLMEGESLLNDGTAIVAFGLMLVIVESGRFSLGVSLVQFVRVAVGGLAVGLLFAALISQIIKRIGDHLIATTLTFVLAYSAYAFAEDWGTSGVLAVVAAGLLCGNLTARSMTPTARLAVESFWEFAAFAVNSIVFLLIGREMNLAVLAAYWQPILWAIVAVLLARAATVYGLSWTGRDIPRSWTHIMYWGGLHGAISLALALSLPESFGSDRVSLQMMAFGVVLFTLLVQSLSMGPFIRRLNIIEKSETRRLYERARAQAAAAKAGLRQLKAMLAEGRISEYVFDIIETQTTDTARLLKEAVQKSVSAESEIAAFERDAAWGEMLRAQRIELQNLLTAGLISEETYRELVQVVDASFENPPSLPETERQKGNFHRADTKDAKGAKNLII